MNVYTAISTFTIHPENILIEPGTILEKYDQGSLVVVSSRYINRETFHSWIGSPSSNLFLEFTSTQADGDSPLSLTPIDPQSNFSTMTIVNKINNILNVVS